jgi:hypothetical protein
MQALAGRGIQMTNYQFRTNWRGQLVLQRLDSDRDRWGDKYNYWRDAQTSDLKDYYQQLCCLQTQHNIREQFERECG